MSGFFIFRQLVWAPKPDCECCKEQLLFAFDLHLRVDKADSAFFVEIKVAADAGLVFNRQFVPFLFGHAVGIGFLWLGQRLRFGSAGGNQKH